MDVTVNWLAVFLAAASSMLVGSIWYARSVFGKMWGELAKIDMSREAKPGQMAGLLVSTFIASLVTAYVLAHVAVLSQSYFSGNFMANAVGTAIWLWLGLVAARLYVHDSFEGRRKKLTLLNSMHELVTFVVMAVIIGLFGV